MYRCQQNAYTGTTGTETYLETETVQFYDEALQRDRPFNGFHQRSLFHSTLQNFQTSQNYTITDYKRNYFNFHSFQSSFGQNPRAPHFQPVMSVVQVVYRVRDAVSYPY